MRAYGQPAADQRRIFSSVDDKLKAFYTGMTLSELSPTATAARMKNEIVYANSMTLEAFRVRLKTNLARGGDFVLINYDRSVLHEGGRGHISPIAAYDEARDDFLILDEAGYKYPFTWVPAELLYKAALTFDGRNNRGLLLIYKYEINAL
jgi:hypothetical protein